ELPKHSMLIGILPICTQSLSQKTQSTTVYFKTVLTWKKRLFRQKTILKLTKMMLLQGKLQTFSRKVEAFIITMLNKLTISNCMLP
ncbi:hypothetical protein MAR_031214, partial [Mya arenaria]